MKQSVPWSGLLLMIGVMIAAWVWKAREGDRLVPAALRGGIPDGCRQLVLVMPVGVDEIAARVWLLARRTPAEGWRIEAGPMDASVGKKGSAWGLGAAGLEKPAIYGEKREGDGRSAAGVFEIPAAFGIAGTPPSGVALPWLECTPTLRGVDDPASRYYNRIVDETTIPDKDWNSAEIMRRPDGLYDIGAVIGHNSQGLAGAGSCIFLHIWKGPGQGTAGCTAMQRSEVLLTLKWLDPAKTPRFALGIGD